MFTVHFFYIFFSHCSLFIIHCSLYRAVWRSVGYYMPGVTTLLGRSCGVWVWGVESIVRILRLVQRIIPRIERVIQDAAVSSQIKMWLVFVVGVLLQVQT